MATGRSLIWRPTPIFAGSTIICVGGGPSLRGFEFSRLRHQHVVAINASGYDLPWADVLFFFDTRWFVANRPLIENWQGLVITPAVPAKDALPDKISCIVLSERVPLARGRSPIKRGRTSGHCAVNVAIAMGAARIVLLGFDCEAVNGRTHYHDRYTEENAAIYRNDFLPAWSGYCEAARSLGCDIVNAGASSSPLTEFPFVPLNEILGDKR